jgi:hypothetical protein
MYLRKMLHVPNVGYKNAPTTSSLIYPESIYDYDTYLIL